MRPGHEIRRARLRQLINEEVTGDTFRGKPAAFARKVDKDPRQVSAWLTGLKQLSDPVARELEDKCMKDSGWLDNEQANGLNEPPPRRNPSHFGGIDPDILHEAETLVLSDEVQTGRKYKPRERARQLAAAYDRLIAEGGRLSAESNARFVDSVTERQGDADDRAADATQRDRASGSRGQ